MPRRPNNTACRVAAIILDLASGRDHTSDALPAASVKTGMATVARVTIRTSACIGGGPIRQPCDQALNDTTNVVLVVGGRNDAAITSSYTLTLFNRIESARIAPVRGHQNTIDRWDDATGENLVVEIRGRGVRVLLLSAKHLVLAAMQS